MTKIESSIKTIPAPQAAVYEKLSNLNNLEKFKEYLPQDKVQGMTFDGDSLTIEAAPAGKVTFKIIEKEPCKCIKFGTTNSPIPLNLWIQIVPDGDDACKLKLTIGLEINPFMKAMVQKPLQQGIEKAADTLAAIRY